MKTNNAFCVTKHLGNETWLGPLLKDAEMELAEVVWLTNELERLQRIKAGVATIWPAPGSVDTHLS